MWLERTLLLLILLNAVQTQHCDFPESLCFDAEPALSNLDLLEAALENSGTPSNFTQPAELVSLINELSVAIKESYGKGYKTCADVPVGSPSGLYLLEGEFRDAIIAYCDMTYNGGGWLVFQKRFNNQTVFQRPWNSYKVGFGELASGEFWWGLDNLYRITNLMPHELTIILEDFNGRTVFANYKTFQIGDETELYRLNVLGPYNGTAGDGMRRCQNMYFTTTDRDNDLYTLNCAEVYTGAWWYSACQDSNLNGQYLNGNTTLYGKGITWLQFTGQDYSLKATKMMIRRIP
ncbi:microfibril-associated glycoprotein 4-like [Anopheles cruzii]|uniref:microfibril-associated glycoprotein 4-like n=1 Tax=Anopheles cruzii TaxID=68878 RepID=UPI0022EC789E|nr:microfibril-associated glycoprotein 4-like [Anopheles cruzii]